MTEWNREEVTIEGGSGNRNSIALLLRYQFKLISPY